MFRLRNWHYSQAPYRRGTTQPSMPDQLQQTRYASNGYLTPSTHCRQSTQSNAKETGETCSSTLTAIPYRNPVHMGTLPITVHVGYSSR